MRYVTVICLCIIALTLTGCSIIEKSPVFVSSEDRIIPVFKNDRIMQAMGFQDLTFDGVIIPNGKYFYLRRCEDYIKQNSLHP